MSANVSDKKLCITCNKAAGIFACQGCENMFCGKHAFEHRHELNGQLDSIASQHDMLTQELAESSIAKSPILEKINTWEKDSIAKIQAAAETARKTLEALFEKSKEKVKQECQNMAEQLRSSREADDFSEKELEKWKTKLKELSLEIKSPKEIQLKLDKKARINLIELRSSEASTTKQHINEKPPPQQSCADETPATPQSCVDEKPPTQQSCGDVNIKEKFLEILGAVIITEEGASVTRTDSWGGLFYVRGQYLYSSGCYVVRIRIESFKQPYRIFLGCMSSIRALDQNVLESSNTAGWFGYNKVYQNGCCNSNCQKSGYNSAKIQINDVLHLTVDCESQEIRLHNERLNKTSTLSVNTKLAPFPWQLVVGLCNSGDSIRILPSASA